MEYTVQKLAKLAGVSTRTLRFYDEIGLLAPARINSSGYRIYGQAEVDLLQQILFYRELGVGLESIKTMMTSPAYDRIRALRGHRRELLNKRKQLDDLLANVDKTLAVAEGKIKMTDQEKFTGFKQKQMDDNEAKYGAEIRAKYGDDKMDQSNRKLMNMTAEEYAEMERLTAEVLDSLAAAYATGDPAGDLAQKTAELHKQWLGMSWGSYSKEAHAELAQMYVDDERFTAYYDAKQPGSAVFLRDAVWIYTGMKQDAQ